MSFSSLGATLALLAVSHAYNLIDDSNQPLMSEKLAYEINTNPESTWNATHLSPKFQRWNLGHAKQFMACGRTDGLEKLPSIQHSAASIASTPSSYDPRVSRKSCTGPVSLREKDLALCSLPRHVFCCPTDSN